MIKECGERGWEHTRSVAPGLDFGHFVPEKAALQPAPQRGAAYQPRVQPWVDVVHNSGVLKERLINID